jgi:hypothetical protein
MTTTQEQLEGLGTYRFGWADPDVAGEQICQHHCPVAHVAAEFPQLCEAETEAFGRLLGMPWRSPSWWRGDDGYLGRLDRAGQNTCGCDQQRV